MSWMPATLGTFGSLPAWVAIGALLLASAYLALYHALFAGLAAASWRRGRAAALRGVPAAWVACDFLRGRGGNDVAATGAELHRASVAERTIPRRTHEESALLLRNFLTRSRCQDGEA